MDREATIDQLRMVISGERLRHTVGVVDTAVKLARMYGADIEKAETAAFFHDIARGYKPGEILKMCFEYKVAADEIEMAVPDLLHGKLGASIAREKYGINDMETLDAIRFHTTGRNKMSKLDKIIFISDMIEPNRNYPGVEILRELALKDLDRSVIEGLNLTIRFVLDRGRLIHPNSIEARNGLIGF